jgi:hypothetical protein
VRSTGCTNNKGSPHRRRRRTIVVIVRGGRERRGAGPSREVESPTPVTTGRGGGRRGSAHGERGGACYGTSVEAPAGAAGALASTTVAPVGVTRALPEPSRKRKRGFSSLR